MTVMRKIVLMLSAAMFLTAASFAQDGKSIGFGVKAGANFANLSIDPEDDEFDPDENRTSKQRLADRMSKRFD